MNEIIAEFIGTFLLILLGNGVVANVVLAETKGHNSGWIVISLGWGLGVFVGVAVAGPVSGAHINPGVTLGLASAGLFPWIKVLPFVLAQMLGAMTGAFLYGFSIAIISTGPKIQQLSWLVFPLVLPFGKPGVIS